MRKKKGFNLRDICGEQIVVAEGVANIDFNNIINMNESAAYLWQQMGDGDYVAEDLAQMLVARYEVDEATALSDCRKLIDEWREVGVIDD